MTLKADTIRQKTPGTREEADRVVATKVAHYNLKRLRSAIETVTPADRLAGRHKAINDLRPQARSRPPAARGMAPGRTPS